jgi:hypothetical protein
MFRIIILIFLRKSHDNKLIFYNFYDFSKVKFFKNCSDFSFYHLLMKKSAYWKIQRSRKEKKRKITMTFLANVNKASFPNLCSLNTR